MQLVLGNWANLHLQVSHATKNQLHKTVAKWQISSIALSYLLAMYLSTNPKMEKR
jgi:hypothetical protein